MNNKFLSPGCWIQTDKCTDDEFAVGLDRDAWGEAVYHTGSNETACLQRAADQWKLCGSNKGDQIVAIYGPTGNTRHPFEGLCFGNSIVLQLSYSIGKNGPLS